MTDQAPSRFSITADGSDRVAAPPKDATGIEDPLMWCQGLLNEIDNDPASVPVAAVAHPSHRRTFSAPPALSQLQIPDVHGALAGKRPERSPLHLGASVGLEDGSLLLAEAFADLRSPAYKKVAADDGRKAGPSPAASTRAGHARSQSYDAAAMAHSGPYKCRGGDSRKEHVCSAVGNNTSAANSTTNNNNNGRSGDGSRESKTIPWTSTEDKVICEGVELHGFKWSLISMSLPGRTDNAVRNRWHRLEQARRWREEMKAQFEAAQAHGNPAAMPGTAFPGYKCRRCGQPKRGHVCPHEDTSQLPAPRPLPPPQASKSSGAKNGSARAQASAPHAQAAKQWPAHNPGPQLATLTMHHGDDLSLSAVRIDGGRGVLDNATTAQRAAHFAQMQAHAQMQAQAHAQMQAQLQVQAQGSGAAQAQTLQRPSTARNISVSLPASGLDGRAHGMTIPMPSPSPQRLAAETPLSAHLRLLESGTDSEMINVGELEDLLFGSLPLDFSDLPMASPLKLALASSPLRLPRSQPPPLTTIPSGEPLKEVPAVPTTSAVPTLERQGTPQTITAS